MGKLIVELPDMLHLQLKKQAIADHKTVKVVVTTLLQQYLKNPLRIAPKSSTGLCGAWKDRRPPEELLSEIRSARRWSIRARS